MTKERYDYLSGQIFEACLEVHRELGPGLLESVYEFALLTELNMRGIEAASQVPVALYYKGIASGKTFEVDILVEDEIIIEIEATLEQHPVHKAQCLTHLKLSGLHLGFLVNFNVPLLKEGFKRLVNNYPY